MCSCPVDPQKTLCDAYNGTINLATLDEGNQNFTPQQEQFLISLANVAAMHELGQSLDGLKTNLVNYSETNSLYAKLNQLNNHEQYTVGWETAYNSSTGSNDALVSMEIGDSGFQLKFYPEKNGSYNALGLVKEGTLAHTIESVLELLEYIDVKYAGFLDDYLYDMHLFNAMNFMEDYCND